MNIKKTLLLVLLVASFVGYTSLTHAKFDSFLKDLKRSLGFDQELSTTKIIAGLKEALRVGTATAASTLSRPGGYLDNPEIRPPAQQVGCKGMSEGMRAYLPPNSRTADVFIHRPLHRPR